MATSPIYGWAEPDNTDLVKNGALAIRTLGNAIDTTMGTMVAKTIIDAKGDLIAGSAADTALRLAVGANGETLVADSSTSTGLRYQGLMAAGKNAMINGAFDIWQRGTSVAVAANNYSYTADRWLTNQQGNVTVSRQVTGDTTNLPFIQYCARFQRDAGQTSTTVQQFTQPFETVNSIPFAGKTVTLSFYARKGANFSQTSSQLSFSLYSGTGTDQNLLQSYTGAAQPLTGTATLTTTWQRFTATGTISTSATEVAPYFFYSPTGTAGANDYYEITGVQLELGSVATAFARNNGTIQGELACAQRYYYRHTATTAYTVYCQGLGATTSIVQGLLPNPVTMRVVPTSIDYLNIAVYDMTTVTGSPSSLGLNQSESPANFNVNGLTGIVVGRSYQILSNNTTSSYIGLSAEL